MAEITEQVQEQPAISGPVTTLLVADDDVIDRLDGIVRHLCIGFMDEMIRATVLFRGGPGRLTDSIGPSPVLPLPDRWFGYRRYKSDEILRAIGGSKPTVVHCLSARLAREAAEWAATWNRGLVVHVTDRIDCRHLKPLRGIPRLAIVTTTPTLREMVLQDRGWSAEQVQVAPLGVPATETATCLAREGRVPAAVVTVPLTKGCGLQYVLNALKVVLDKGHQTHLFVLATGPGEAMFRKAARQMGLRSHVTFAGRMQGWTALRDAIRGGDIYILPAERSRFTVSTLMAMGEGLAVLAPTGTIGDYLIDDTTASLFNARVPAELAGKWSALLAGPDEARRLAEGALNHIRTHHQASMMVSRVTAIYRSLCV